MKNRSQIYEINRSGQRYGCKYIKYKIYISIIMVIFKQHLSKTLSSIHEKVKQHWGWAEKKRCLYKKIVYK